MYSKVLHLKVGAVEIFRFLERRLPQEGLQRIDGAWWEGENGHGFLLFRRAFLRTMGATALLIRVDNVNGRISRVQLTAFACGWFDLGSSEETVGDVIQNIRRFYTDGCLEQVHEEVWRYLGEIGFEVTPSRWRRSQGTAAFISSGAYRGIVSVRVTRDGCSDGLVKDFAKELAGIRQYNQLELAGLLVVGCPEGIPNAPFLTSFALLDLVERMGFTLIGFRRLQEIVVGVREGRISAEEGRRILTKPGVIHPEIVSPEVAAALQRD